MDQVLVSRLHSLAEVAEDPAAYAVDGMEPALALLPGTEAEVAGILAAAAAHGAAVIPRGAGSSQDLGNPPERAGVVLSLERLNRVLAYNPADMTITVEAGMPLADLQALAARHGQTLALDPPRAARATIGGLVATGASGPRRMAYGGMRDLLLGTRIAMTDGTVVKTGGRVVKNVAGYDMNKLVNGSLGTLGVITEVTLKLRPLPAVTLTGIIGFPDTAAALTTAEALLNSELLPAAVVVLSPGASRRLEAGGPVALAVALEETAENVAYQLERLTALAGKRIHMLTGGGEAAFWNRVSDYGDLYGHGFRLKVNTTIADVVNHLQTGSLLDGIAYVGTGTVMLYGSDTPGTPGQMAEAAESVMARAAAAGGSAVLESAPLPVRRLLDVWGPPRPEWKLMRGLKERFDPGRILNPGRFIGGM